MPDFFEGLGESLGGGSLEKGSGASEAAFGIVLGANADALPGEWEAAEVLEFVAAELAESAVVGCCGGSFGELVGEEVCELEEGGFE